MMPELVTDDDEIFKERRKGLAHQCYNKISKILLAGRVPDQKLYDKLLEIYGGKKVDARNSSR